MRNLLGRLVSWFGRRAQPAPLDASHPFAGESEEHIKSDLSALIRASHDEGVAAESGKGRLNPDGAGSPGAPGTSGASRSRRRERHPRGRNLGASERATRPREFSTGE